ncbi:hypothetical protein [Sphingomonas paucimobilis]|uniref:Uncharacterized protein n=1 Tax=Sphingomonas paucimobilis TaxID=13689 RepID=A0A7Y2KTD4_SPHPI|nr:hypothetical protein [Sphingomonas paucimobilis]NNG59804.1 hypothetical protein [Sphingomonas paucimobilis]
MEQLPPHVATADEPIEHLRDRPWDGPDMRCVMPIEMMLGALHRTSDAAGYLTFWRTFVKSVGGWVGLTISRDGEEELGFGTPCDAQTRHRSRWLHFLSEDLNRDPDRRDLLISSLIASGHYADNRPADVRATTRAIREFLRTQGRILIDPDGNLTEGGGAPRLFTHGSDTEAAECIRASRFYFAVRRRWRSERHIKRAVRMLGSRTNNGWLVLEARA